MNSDWQLAATSTFDLGWDQMIVLAGEDGANARLLHFGLLFTAKAEPRDHAAFSAQ